MPSLQTDPLSGRTPEELLADVYQRAPRLRRRRSVTRTAMGAAVAVIAVAAVTVGLAARTGRTTQVVTTQSTVTEAADALAIGPDGSPTQYVEMSLDEGITVKDGSTGQIVRTVVADQNTPPTTSTLGSGTITRSALSLSADRRTIYFTTTTGGGFISVFAVPVVGGSVHDVFDFPVGNIFWNYAISPDGTSIAWLRFDPGARSDSVVVTQLSTGAEIGAATGFRLSQFNPAWLDNTHLAVTAATSPTDTQVQLLGLTGRALATTTTLTSAPGCTYSQPVRAGEDNLAVTKTCGPAKTVVLVDQAIGHELSTLLVPADGPLPASYTMDPTGSHLIYAAVELIAGGSGGYHNATYRVDAGTTLRLPARNGLAIEVAW